MITIRRLTFDLPDNGDTLLTHIQLDTEKVKFRLADFFIRWQIEMDKPWIGEIKKGEFKIIRTRAGLFKLNFSRILIAGQIKNDEKKGKIELRLGLPGYVVLGLLYALILFVALTIYYFQDIWGLIITISLLIIQTMLITVDMNKTENMFVDYLESVKSNKPQQCA
jgi:hypothetical protein